MKKILPCIALILCFFLTGCTNQTYSLIINDDDSSTFTVRVVVDKDTYDLLNSYDIEKNYNFEQKETSSNSIEQCDVLFQETAAVFNQYGFEISPVNDAVEIGFQGVKKYTAIDDLNKDLVAMYNDGLINFVGEVSVDSSIFGKTYLFSGKVAYKLDPDAEISEEEKNQLLELYDTSSLSAKVSLKMPGQLVAHDGTIEDGLAVYSATYDEGTEVPVHLKTSISNTPVKIGLGLVVFVGVVVGGVFLARNMKKKREARKMEEMYEDDGIM